MAVSLDRSSPSHLNKKSSISMESSPLLSPSSEKQFWSALRSRVDTLLENRQLKEQTGRNLLPDQDLPSKAPSAREDCLLLLRGFDSISSSLSLLKGNIDTALQGAKDLSNPSLTELLHNDSEKPEGEIEEEEEGNKRTVKRKHESRQSSDDQEDLESKENEQSPKNGQLKKAKKLAISMATNAASLARELKSIKSDLSFMQERCALLEEENRRLREGSEKGLRPEEDDLVRLQLEALLAEKSRLANENANLIRENQCLHQLVEYHQLTSQEDISESYEQVVRGMCLDFSSPTEKEPNNGEIEAPLTPHTDIFGFSTCLDQYYDEEHK
ncbi:hypothetical protein BVC80_441g265 [Macleaya cordata]|uniref:Uncharacterized protein n=1 Tax=Macleaya cordata TaxID=56857 RepID=A0A200Q4S5_MACCD|nr:hypothetical protein BVC80_441g265 [Macleaya cordata]